jgi:hypothetical protein
VFTFTVAMKTHFELYIHNTCLIYDKLTKVQKSLSHMVTALKMVRLCRKMTFILFL